MGGFPHLRTRLWHWTVSAWLLGLTSGGSACADFVAEKNERVAGQIDTYTTTDDDTLLDVARTHDLGYTQLMAANPNVNPWLPGNGKTIVLPTYYILPDVPHRGIVINLAWQRLFYFTNDGKRVKSYPIGVGIAGHATPVGVTFISGKEPNPVWIPTPSIRAAEPNLPLRVPPGPNNPLGAFALHLGWPDYLIHGTNKPYGVGRDVSHGCIRLYPEDIEKLFHQVTVGTRVQIIRQESAAAWIGDKLVVQVYPNKSQADEIDTTGHFTPDFPTDLVTQVITLRDQRHGQIDWDAVRRAGLGRTGLPVQVGDLPRNG